MDSELADENGSCCCSDSFTELWNEDKKNGNDKGHDVWNFKLGLMFHGE